MIVLDALQYTDLLTVYYSSGHAVNSGSVWSAEVRRSPFPNWQWSDFSQFDICAEKPPELAPQKIHDAIGQQGDRSLFAWVVKNYGSSGWLTCDDGPGEVADFVKYDGDGTLTLVHVKAAKSDSSKRRVNVTSYEVVTSQATKNLSFLNTRHLLERIANPAVSSPACWYNGGRAEGRGDLIEYLKLRPSHAPVKVVIIQPQLTEQVYKETHSRADETSERRPSGSA